jgi:hypothetical protein
MPLIPVFLGGRLVCPQAGPFSENQFPKMHQPHTVFYVWRTVWGPPQWLGIACNSNKSAPDIKGAQA